MRSKGFSMVGILVALTLLSTVMLFILRFNHRVEKRLYQDMTTANQLRFEAWSYVEGRLPRAPVGQLNRKTINGIPCYIVESNNGIYYLIPP